MTTTISKSPAPARRRLPAPLRRFLGNRLAVVGLFVLLIFAVSALLASWVAPYDPAQIFFSDLRAAPSAAHPFGADELGRDIFSRVVYGARVSLSAGLVSVSLALVFGGGLGLIAGFVGGWLDDVLMRVVDALLALPFLVLALEGSLRTTGLGYEQAAAGLGAGRWTILGRVTLPLAAPGLIAGIVLCFARAVGEFGATALFAGNAPGVTQTMPLAIYTAFNGAGVSQGSAVALSLLLLVTAIGVLLLVRAWRPEAPR